MGLDMYLEAERSFYNCEYMKDEPKYKEELMINKKLRRMFPEMFKSGNMEYVRLSFEAGYWRKSNHIHKWFVDNVQDGDDDCKRYYVDREKLKELLEFCKEVVKKSKLKNGSITNGYTIDKDGKKIYNMEKGKIISNIDTAVRLLPTQEGFFFGSTDYDEWYLSDVKETIDILDKCLKLPKEWEFYYHSSW